MAEETAGRAGHESRSPRRRERLTPDGRRMREVRSFARRGGRFTPRQAEAWQAHHDAWVIPDDVVEATDFNWASWFGREAPLIVEIGSGIGEATAALAASRPEQDIVALEVWRPGVAEGLARVASTGVTNVRFCSVDAVWVLQHLFDPGTVAELWTFFPDPWPKARHHKRRMITPEFAAVAASRLRVGAVWRLATDWDHYAEQMVEVLSAEPLLVGGRVPRWAERPVTKFERKGLAVGREIADFTYRRVDVS